MRTSVLVPAVLAGFGAAAASAEPVTFAIMSQSVLVDRAAKAATFTLTFSHAPDFQADVTGKQTNTFQYEIDAAWSGMSDPGTPDANIGFDRITTVIRGGEIWMGNGIPVRNRDGNGGAYSGGWGPVREFIPFKVEGDTVNFTANFGDIGDNNGVFRYRVFTTDNGEVTSESTGVAVPLPAGVAMGIAMLGGLGIAHQIRRRRRC